MLFARFTFVRLPSDSVNELATSGDACTSVFIKSKMARRLYSDCDGNLDDLVREAPASLLAHNAHYSSLDSSGATQIQASHRSDYTLAGRCWRLGTAISIRSQRRFPM